MDVQMVYVVSPSKRELDNGDLEPYYEFLYTSSMQEMRKYLKCTDTDEDLVHAMPLPVFEKFKKHMYEKHGSNADFLEIYDQGGGMAIPNEYVEVVEEGASDIIFNVKNLATELVRDLDYFKNPEFIKVKKDLNKLLKYLKKNPMSSLEEFKYKKVIKEYYRRKDDDDG